VNRDGQSDLWAEKSGRDDHRLNLDAVHECRRRLRICAESKSTELDFDLDEAFERAMVYKNHALSRSCLVHLAVAIGCNAARKEQGAQLVQSVLDCRADLREKARYRNPNGTETEFEAIHIAAGIGCMPILEVLLKCAVYDQPSDPGASLESLRCAYVRTWASIIPPEGSDLPATPQNYQPIHDAAFGRQTGNILWLLENRADASVRNNYGFTALHFVALNGVGTDDTAEVERVVKRLLEDDVSTLEVKVEPTHHDRRMRDKIPLELAASAGSQFPKDCMHLLAPSLSDACCAEPRFFQDLLLLAKSNTTHAAGALARKICENVRGPDRWLWKARLRQEAQKWVRSQHLIDAGVGDHTSVKDNPSGLTINGEVSGGRCGASTLASLFFMVPRAAADMVDILLAKPLVQDPAKHPVPGRASLLPPATLFMRGSCQPMVCSYQTDSVMHGDVLRPQWKFNAEMTERDQPEIQWHRELVYEPRETQVGRRDDVCPVATKVILWPNILELDICRALVCTPPEDDAIFARLPVQAICYWFWNNLGFPAFVVTWIFRSIELGALVWWGIDDEGHSSQSSPICWVVLVAGNIRECGDMLWCFKEYCSRYWEHQRSQSVLRALWSPWGFIAENAVDVISVLLRMWLLLDEEHVGTEQMTDFGQALIAVNVMFGFFRLIYMMRLLDKMGTGILAILETFFSGAIQQMFFIFMMVFANFLLAFTMLARTKDMKDALEVFLQLYRGFLFGDGEALDYLGLDEGPAQDGYTHIPSGPYLSIDMNLNRILALFGTLFFNVIILNLIIAIYGSEYEKKKRVSGLLWLKQRLRTSCDSVLSYRKLEGPAPMWLSACVLPMILAAAVDLLRAEPALPRLREWNRMQRIMSAAFLFACSESILQMVILQGLGQRDRVHVHYRGARGEEPRFLWICHRSDFSARAHEGEEVKKRDLFNLADDVNRKIAHVEAKMDAVGKKLEAKLDRVLLAVEHAYCERRKTVAFESSMGSSS